MLDQEQHSELTVLGYVTPWNPRGKHLTEEYRRKFDLVSPVWYTVHADESQPGRSQVLVQGGTYHGLDFSRKYFADVEAITDQTLEGTSTTVTASAEDPSAPSGAAPSAPSGVAPSAPSGDAVSTPSAVAPSPPSS